MAGRRRHLRRRRSWDFGNGPIAIRVGSRRNPRRFVEIVVNGPQDAQRFARLIDDQTRACPDDPLLICINGYQPWLEDVLSVCIQDNWQDVSDLGREVEFAQTMQFPERASKRGQVVPWTFIVDHMNVPQVYYWSIGQEPPEESLNWGLPSISQFRFRCGVWQMAQGAISFDRNVPVTIIFTLPNEVSEHVVTELLFGFIYRDPEFSRRREDEERICWIFSRLYWLLSDWQNILAEIAIRLREADKNSHGRNLPVKLRARMMHREVDRIYEMKEFLHFHSRSFKKLQKLKEEVSQEEQNTPLWNDMDDAVEDLDQFDGTMDSLKERFNNLLDLEFNIQNAEQSDNSSFLSIIATLFLPISFLTGVWGFTTTTLMPITYVYVAIPVLVVSAAFAFSFDWAVKKIQKLLYPVESLRLPLEPNRFTMLGEELPESVNTPGSKPAGGGRPRRKGTRPLGGGESSDGGGNGGGGGGGGSRSRSRRFSEKDDYR